MTFLFVMTVVALVFESGCLLVFLLLRLAEEHRDIADMRRLHEAQRHHNQYIPR